MINHGKSDQSRGSVRVAHPHWVDQHLKSHNQSRYEVPAPSFISMEGIGYNIPPLFLRKGFINYVVRLCVTIVCPEHMKSSSVHFRVLNIVATSQKIPGKIPQNAFGPRRQSNHGVWFFFRLDLRPFRPQSHSVGSDLHTNAFSKLVQQSMKVSG